MKQAFRNVIAVAAICAASGSVSAQLVINPIFDSSITSNPNAAAMMTAINLAIAQEQGFVTNPVVVNILFKNVPDGLGSSSTFYNNLSYSQYRTDLLSNPLLSANDIAALATLPSTAGNPVNGSGFVRLSLPLLRAIGETALGTNFGDPDSTIGLNMSLMNLSRSGPQDSDKYDLQQVALHEIQEVLGSGGAGSRLGGTGTAVGALDLYRYSGAGTRSYSQSAESSYFSINGGLTNLSFFNQVSGGDYGDWAETPPQAATQVQDAFSTPGKQLNLSLNEMVSIDVIGWNVTDSSITPTPLPATALLFGPALLVGAFARRHRNRHNG